MAKKPKEEAVIQPKHKKKLPPGYSLNIEIGTPGGFTSDYTPQLGKVKRPSDKLWHGDAGQQVGAAFPADGWAAVFRHANYVNSYVTPSIRHFQRPNFSFFDGSVRGMSWVEVTPYEGSNTNANLTDAIWKKWWDLNENGRQP